MPIYILNYDNFQILEDLCKLLFLGVFRSVCIDLIK